MIKFFDGEEPAMDPVDEPEEGEVMPTEGEAMPEEPAA
jgi:hypothetical protein